MARGQQKIQSQQKNAEKRAKSKKGSSQLKAAGAALVHSCPVCKVYIFSIPFSIVNNATANNHLIDEKRHCNQASQIQIA